MPDGTLDSRSPDLETLLADDDDVTIQRDAYGVLHVFVRAMPTWHSGWRMPIG